MNGKEVPYQHLLSFMNLLPLLLIYSNPLNTFLILVFPFIGIYDNEYSYQALKKEFPSLETECFMSKPVRTEGLIRRIIGSCPNYPLQKFSYMSIVYSYTYPTYCI